MVSSHNRLGNLYGVPIVKESTWANWRRPEGSFVNLNIEGAVQESVGRDGVGCVVRG